MTKVKQIVKRMRFLVFLYLIVLNEYLIMTMIQKIKQVYQVNQIEFQHTLYMQDQNPFAIFGMTLPRLHHFL